VAEGFEFRDPGFSHIVPDGAVIERIATGFGFTEGPLWDGDRLLFSDLGNSQIVSWRQLPEGTEVETVRAPSHIANGLTFDRQHRLIVCEGGFRRLTRTEPSGSITVLAERYRGRRLNSPNDVIVRSDGTLFFSDPFWGHMFANPPGPNVRLGDRELGFAGVFRLGSGGTLAVVADDFDVPNGLAFSPDERILYVDDSRHGHIRAFDVSSDGSLTNGRLFACIRTAEPGGADGMKVDREGNVYCTGHGAAWVIAPNGVILGRITPPEVPANVAWGGPDWQTLFLTARTSVYRVQLNVPGIAVWS
jgi:gluconolactonase